MIDYLIGVVKMLVNKLLGNPVAAAVVNSVIEDMKSEGAVIMGIVVANIKAVAVRTDLDNSQKFSVVFEEVKKQFPNTASSLLNSIIESTYRAYTQGRI